MRHIKSPRYGDDELIETTHPPGHGLGIQSQLLLSHVPLGNYRSVIMALPDNQAACSNVHSPSLRKGSGRQVLRRVEGDLMMF